MADDDTRRQLDLAFTSADAAHRIAARNGLGLDRARQRSRTLDTRRATHDADSTRSADAVASLAQATARLVSANGNAERSHTKPFRPADRVCTIHGRVHGLDGRGIAKLAVRATSDGTSRGEARTDERGYFRIDIGADRRPLPGTGIVGGAAIADLPRVPFLLSVTEDSTELLVERGTTLVRPGRSVYRELLVRR